MHRGKISNKKTLHPEGGIGEAMLSAVRNEEISIQSLAVGRLPRSGKPKQLLTFEGIDADAIVEMVQKFN